MANPGVLVIIVSNEDPTTLDDVEWFGSELQTIAIINMSSEYKISKYKKAYIPVKLFLHWLIIIIWNMSIRRKNRPKKDVVDIAQKIKKMGSNIYKKITRYFGWYFSIITWASSDCSDSGADSTIVPTAKKLSLFSEDRSRSLDSILWLNEKACY